MGNVNYNTWVQQELAAKGLKTTNVSGDAHNFADYGNALSESLRKEITNSFDKNNERDFALQNQIAQLYQQKSNYTTSQFMAECKKMGLSVSSTWYSDTGHIVDDKAMNGRGEYSSGGVSLLTISDGKGGEIKIADSNGNGAIEVEELFMNQLLEGVSTSIDIGSLGGINYNNNEMSEFEEIEEEKEEDSETYISYTLRDNMIDMLLEEYMNEGMENNAEARMKAREQVDMNYNFSTEGEHISQAQMKSKINAIH